MAFEQFSLFVSSCSAFRFSEVNILNKGFLLFAVLIYTIKLRG